MKPRLVIFARAPRVGGVKRRLGRDIGAVAACRFYVDTMHRVVWRLSRDARWDCRLAVTPGPARWPARATRIAQGEGSLGQRMDRVMRGQPPGPVVIIGTDIPDIRPHHIAEAFAALGNHDAVFGPADDGGFWLVGLRRCPFTPRLDGPVRWSTRHALADTLQVFGPRVRSAMLETLIDIDDAAAMDRWRRRAAARR